MRKIIRPSGVAMAALTLLCLSAPALVHAQTREDLVVQAFAEFDATRQRELLRAALNPALGAPDSIFGVGVQALAQNLIDAGQESLADVWLKWGIRSHPGMSAGRVHPQTVYEDLIRLAGALCTFSLDTDPRSIPRYDHDLPEEVFDGLEKHIRRHLEVVIPESYVSVGLTRSDTNLHTAALEDKRLVGASEWVLRVSSSAATGTIIDAVPRKVKVGSAEDVMRLVEEGRPALALEHLPSPPTTIAPRVGSQYFRISRKGPVWKLIEGRSTVGVFVPDALPEVEVEILVVHE